MLRDRFRKGSCVTASQYEKILEDALQLLEHVGIGVPPGPLGLCEMLAAGGSRCRDGRVFLSREDVLAYLQDLRGWEERSAPIAEDRLTGMVSIYSGYHETLKGKIEPFDTKTLIDSARFCQLCGEAYGFAANVPGYARDVPGELESLHKYMVSAQYCANTIPEPSSLISARYMFAMADVLGHRLARLPAFPLSPLTLAGSSVEAVVENKHRLTSAYVYAMSFLGISTPMSVHQGFAVNLAEVLGCALLLHRLTGLPVDIRPNLIPFDFNALNVSFGSPEKWILELMAADLYAHLTGKPMRYHSANIHTHAKHSGAQSAFEKGSLMAMGAQYGATKFYCIGTLALDEVFSPTQLVWDLEMMRQLEKSRTGFTEDAAGDSLLELVEKHLSTGFLSSDLTLDNYSMIGSSGIFDRSAMGAYSESGVNDALENAREIAAKLSAKESSYHLPEIKSRELEKIYERAWNEIDK